MFSRFVPLFALFCVLVVAVTTFLAYRSATREEDDKQQSQGVRVSAGAHTVAEQLRLAEEYAIRAEAAAARAQVALQAIESIQAKLQAEGQLPAPAAK